MKKVLFVMGVSGSGKTSVGTLLADDLSVPFIDADDHHPPANIEKMSRGIPLVDEDRWPWLDTLHGIAVEHLEAGCVIACSALREVYRQRLSESIEEKIQWIYLRGTYDQIYERMKKRTGHFMEPAMLISQFDTLEEPENAIYIDIQHTPEVIIQHIKSHLV